MREAEGKREKGKEGKCVYESKSRYIKLWCVMGVWVREAKTDGAPLRAQDKGNRHTGVAAQNLI